MAGLREAGKAARRRLLGLIGVAVATPAVAINADGSRGGLPAQPESEVQKRAPRYRETDHVRAFYRTNRS